MSKPKRLCDRNCPNQASFLLRLRDRAENATETSQAVCGTHLTRSVHHLEEVAREIRRLREERGVTFEGEILVASWRGGVSSG